jgi:hypothetical protein
MSDVECFEFLCVVYQGVEDKVLTMSDMEAIIKAHPWLQRPALQLVSDPSEIEEPVTAESLLQLGFTMELPEAVPAGWL